MKNTATTLERAKSKKSLCPLSQVAPREVAKSQSDMYYRLNLVHNHVLFGKHSIFRQFGLGIVLVSSEPTPSLSH